MALPNALLLFTAMALVMAAAASTQNLQRQGVERDRALSALQRSLVGSGSGYMASMPPPTVDALPPNVSVFIGLTNLLDVDDIEQRLHVHLFVQFEWLDARLAWNDTAIAFLPVASGDIASVWTPPISIHQRTYHSDRPVLVDDAVLVQPDGRVQWNGTFVDTIVCPILCYQFPFDTHRCKFSVVADKPMLMHFNYELAKRINGEYHDRYRNAIGDDEIVPTLMAEDFIVDWRETLEHPLVETRHFDLQHSNVIYTIALRRWWVRGFYIWVLPATILTVGAIIGIYCGAEADERYTVGASVVVALVLMVSGLTAALPASGYQYPVIGTYYSGLIAILLLSVFVSTLPRYVFRNYILPLKQRKEGFSGYPKDSLKELKACTCPISDPICLVVSLTALVGLVAWATQAWLSDDVPL